MRTELKYSIERFNSNLEKGKEIVNKFLGKELEFIQSKKQKEKKT